MARPRRSHATRERLLDQGVEVLTERGYHGTGLKEILDALQVPKGSFYNYFKSKEDFGAEVVSHYARLLDDQLYGVLDGDGDALSALEEFFAIVAQLHEEKQLGCLVGNLGAELGDGYQLIRQAMVDALHGWRDRLERTLARAQQQGTVRSDLPSGVLADFLFDGTEGALLRMRIEKNTEPIKRFSSLVLGEFFAPR